MDDVGFLEHSPSRRRSCVPCRDTRARDDLPAEFAPPYLGKGRVGVNLLVERAGLFGGRELQLRHIRVRHDGFAGGFENRIAPRVIAVVVAC